MMINMNYRTQELVGENLCTVSNTYLPCYWDLKCHGGPKSGDRGFLWRKEGVGEVQFTALLRP